MSLFSPVAGGWLPGLLSWLGEGGPEPQEYGQRWKAEDVPE